jgi:Zn-dependent peptidase ImmA (M78 family)
MRRLELNDLLDAIDQVAPYSIPKCDVDDFNGDIEQIAASVRSAWRMPSGPVSNIIAQLEAASCIVFAYSFDSDKIDEIVQWIEPTPPIILVNSNAPSDRLRFSLAHALGHLVMHHNRTPYPKMEEEADRFASAFLMPDEDIRAELTPVTIDHMLYLKPYWKVSMQALIRRARDIEVISERQYQSLFQMLSRVGYRRQEPVTISPEKPELIATILDLYRQELKYTDKELAELLRLNVSDFRAWYYPKPPHLTVLDKPKRLIE